MATPKNYPVSVEVEPGFNVSDSFLVYAVPLFLL